MHSLSCHTSKMLRTIGSFQDKFINVEIFNFHITICNLNQIFSVVYILPTNLIGSERELKKNRSKYNRNSRKC
jgi:hypothetical protein